MQIRSLYALLGFRVDGAGAQKFNSVLRTLRFDLIAITALWAGMSASLGLFLREAGKMEQINVAFETMLGSVQMSKKLLADLFEFARVTPFRIPGVLSTTRILLGMGVSSDKMVTTLTDLGNVAAGLSVPLEQIALSYGKVAAAGYLTGYELQNLRRAGVPLVREMSKILGVGREEIQSMVRKRKISFELFEQAFKNMSAKGGTFHNLMQRQAKTYFGIISNIKDGLQIISIRIGEGLLPQAKKLANQFLMFLDLNKEIIKLRMVKFLTQIGKFLYRITVESAKMLKSAFQTLDAIIGIERVSKMLFITLGAIIGLKVLSTIGKITMALNIFGNAALLANLKAAAIPIAIGAAVLLVLALFEDIYKWISGEKGTSIMDFLDAKYFGGGLRDKVLELWDLFKDILEWDKQAIKNTVKWINDVYNAAKAKIDAIRPYLEALGLMIAGIITLDANAIKTGYDLFKTLLKERADKLHGEGKKTTTEKTMGGLRGFRSYLEEPDPLENKIGRVKKVTGMAGGIGNFAGDVGNWMQLPWFAKQIGEGLQMMNLWGSAGYYKDKLNKKYHPRYSPLQGDSTGYNNMMPQHVEGVLTNAGARGERININIDAKNADAREVANIVKNELNEIATETFNEKSKQEKRNALKSAGAKTN